VQGYRGEVTDSGTSQPTISFNGFATSDCASARNEGARATCVAHQLKVGCMSCRQDGLGQLLTNLLK
jgi:hypothetical protein